jgi:hypothetical protein
MRMHADSPRLVSAPAGPLFASLDQIAQDNLQKAVLNKQLFRNRRRLANYREKPPFNHLEAARSTRGASQQKLLLAMAASFKALVLALACLSCLGSVLGQGPTNLTVDQAKSTASISQSGANSLTIKFTPSTLQLTGTCILFLLRELASRPFLGSILLVSPFPS